MKTFNLIAPAIFVGVVGFIAYSLLKDSGKKYYSTSHAQRDIIEERLHLSGYICPSKEIEIKSQISGVVSEVFVHVGDNVKKGDPIVSVNLVPNASEVEQLKNRVKVAEIDLSVARTAYDRQKQLLEKKAISKAEFEAAEKDYLTANENYSSALVQLSLRQKGGGTTDNIVRSSTSGIVIDIPVKVGTSVVERNNFNVGTTVSTIAGTDHYIFKSVVPEKNIGKLFLGMPVNLTLLAYEGVEIKAAITKISAKGDLSSGAVKFPVEAEFTFQDAPFDLRSGYSATAEVLIASAQDVLALPEKCIHFKGDTTYVYVTDSLRHKVTEKIVSIGLSDGERVQIIDGITSQDYVITNYHD